MNTATRLFDTRTVEMEKLMVLGCAATDKAFAPAGEVLYSCPTGNCDTVDLQFAGEEGLFVAYVYDSDPASETYGCYVTVDPADPSLKGEVIFGQFEKQYGSSYVNGIRKIAGQSFNLCNLDRVDTASWSCPQPQVLLATMEDCVACNDTFTFELRYNDAYTRAFSNGERPYEAITASVSVDCCEGCEDCGTNKNCQPLMVEAVRRLNGKHRKGADGKGGYPGIPRQVKGSEKNPIKFLVAQEYWKVYCLKPNKDECSCDDCTTIEALTSITIGGKTIEFKNNLNAKGDKTYRGQLDNIVSQIDCAFDDTLGEGRGGAFVTNGDGCCCSHQLHIVTCDKDVALGELVPCKELNPLKPFTTKETPLLNDCETGDCLPDEEVENKHCCGIMAILDQDPEECDPCDLTVPKEDRTRTGELCIIKGNPLKCAPMVTSKELLCPKLSTNSGGDIKWMALNQDAEGEWWCNDSIRGGYFNELTHDKQGRYRNATNCVKCDKYCTYETYYTVKRYQKNGKTPMECLYKTTWAIPKSLPLAKADFEAKLAAIVERSSTNCEDIKFLTCEEVATDGCNCIEDKEEVTEVPTEG